MLNDDLTAQYNTTLSPAEEAAFVLWATKHNRMGDLRDYDMRGAWKAQVGQAGNGHFPDTYKKPNHPTFSTESKYDNPKAPMGGRWSFAHGRDVFEASQHNVQQMGADGLHLYFQHVEPHAKLVIR